MICNVSIFTLTNRRHHCRNCGKVACGKCSSYKAVLNKGVPERVCSQCHATLGGGDIPVLGRASTMSTGPKQTVEDGDGGSSDESSDDDHVGGGSSLSNSEMKMHQLSDEDRIAIMLMVKEGKLTMEQAMARIARGESLAASAAGSVAAPAGAASVPSASESPAEATGLTAPHAVALYDNDDPEHDDELIFAAGEIIILTERVDDDWLEGHLQSDASKTLGIFPSAFVRVVVDV